MPNITQQGIDLIKYFEGLRLIPYLCPAGYYTVGYGHLISPPYPESITQEQADDYLQQDLYTAEKAVCRLITIPLNDNQFSALVSFTFNLGSGALQRSTLRMIINRGEISGIPGEFMRWTKAKGRILPGLVQRRAAEANLYFC